MICFLWKLRKLTEMLLSDTTMVLSYGGFVHLSINKMVAKNIFPLQ